MDNPYPLLFYEVTDELSTVNDQGGHIDAGDILPEILDPSWNTGQAGRGGCARSDVATGAHDFLCEKRVAVGSHGFLGLFDRLSALAYKTTKKTGELVLPGFGKLVKQKRKARTGFNPKTQQKIRIPAKTVLKFRVAKVAKDTVLGVKK